MKKLIIFLTILISTIFSNVTFADIMVPGANCHDYDKICYKKCLKNGEYKKSGNFFEKGECKDECCIKEKKYCTNELCTCMLKRNSWAVCRHRTECEWNCTNGENISFFERYKSIFTVFYGRIIFTILIVIIGIFIYKRKKSKKG